jgi:hypothetical protein
VSLRALSPIPLYAGAALVLALAGAGGRLARAEDEAAPKGIASWFNPTTAPFIPVPEIDHDPNSGLTLGLIPTWLVTDDKQQITRIIAPDVLYNPYFGYGVRGRIYAFPSNDAQWSTVAGAKERVESEFDSEYQTGRSRNTALSFNTSVVYDRSGTPRFYGIGNSTPESDQTNYTLQQMYAQVRAGWNLSRRWQIAYTMRAREVKIQEGTLDGIPSLDDFFGPIPGVGITHETCSTPRCTARADWTRASCGRSAPEVPSPRTRHCATCRVRPMCRSGVCRISAAIRASWTAASRCAATARDAFTTAIHFR